MTSPCAPSLGPTTFLWVAGSGLSGPKWGPNRGGPFVSGPQIDKGPPYFLDYLAFDIISP